MRSRTRGAVALPSLSSGPSPSLKPARSFDTGLSAVPSCARSDPHLLNPQGVLLASALEGMNLEDFIHKESGTHSLVTGDSLAQLHGTITWSTRRWFGGKVNNCCGVVWCVAGGDAEDDNKGARTALHLSIISKRSAHASLTCSLSLGRCSTNDRTLLTLQRMGCEATGAVPLGGNTMGSCLMAVWLPRAKRLEAVEVVVVDVGSDSRMTESCGMARNHRFGPPAFWEAMHASEGDAVLGKDSPDFDCLQSTMSLLLRKQSLATRFSRTSTIEFLRRCSSCLVASIRV